MDNLIAFFNSDFCKNNIVLLVVLAIILFVLGFICGWAYMKYIRMPLLSNKVKKLEEEKDHLNERINNAENELTTVKNEFREYKQKHDKETFASEYDDYKEIEENDSI